MALAAYPSRVRFWALQPHARRTPLGFFLKIRVYPEVLHYLPQRQGGYVLATPAASFFCELICHRALYKHWAACKKSHSIKQPAAPLICLW